MIYPDELFSYWIFGWYFVYMIGYTKYNPMIALMIGNIANMFVLIAMIYFKTKFKNILYFIIVNLFFKILPLWTLRNTKIKKIDIYATFILFLVYVGWIFWKEVWIKLYSAYDDMIHNKISMPGMLLLEKLNIL